MFISLPRLDSIQAAIFKRYWYPFDDVPRHLYHFSRKALLLLLRQTDFEIERIVFFSRRVNFHSLKHSLLNWSRERTGSAVPYYLLKPLLLFFPLVEEITGSYGILTMIARKSPERAGVSQAPRVGA